MKALKCNRALQQLQAHFENPSNRKRSIKTALEHILSCENCRSRLLTLKQAAASQMEDPIHCEECQQRLPDFLQASIEAGILPDGLEQVSIHLKTCPHCLRVYQDLQEMTRSVYQDWEEAPQQFAPPDLSFLETARTPPNSLLWSLNETGRMIVEFTREWLEAASRTAGPAPAFAMRSSGEALQAAAGEAEIDLEVSFTIEPEGAHPDTCTIGVEVNIPSKGGWPNLANSEVLLTRGDMVNRETTDAFGQAHFDGIPTKELGALLFEIIPAR